MVTEVDTLFIKELLNLCYFNSAFQRDGGKPLGRLDTIRDCVNRMFNSCLQRFEINAFA